VVGGSNPLVPTNYFSTVALILLTNDDGIEAAGLRSLEASLRGLADLLVVAPDQERSAASHGLTIHKALEFKTIDQNHYTLNGTPADCVIFSLTQIADTLPDLVISGINHGANMGDDLMYSGTVAAAREASRHGIPSMAVSQSIKDGPIQFVEAVKFVRQLAEEMLAKKSFSGICLNVNIPAGRPRGIKITRQGCSFHFPEFTARGVRGGLEHSPHRADHAKKSEIMPDFHAVIDQYISVTPLQRDQTDYLTIRSLGEEIPRLFRQRRNPRMGLIP
jgi:5'-nucleotidase